MAPRRATVDDIHRVALGMPYTKRYPGSEDNPIYQVGSKSFVFFRNPRPDAIDPESGERLTDVIVFWVASEAEKQALLQSGEPGFGSDPRPSVVIDPRVRTNDSPNRSTTRH